MSKQTFDFSEALRRMKEGKKVKRTSWEVSDGIWIEQGKLYYKNKNTYSSSSIIYHISDSYYPVFTLEDVLATDWEEVES